jgi:hypothetical protein
VVIGAWRLIVRRQRGYALTRVAPEHSALPDDGPQANQPRRNSEPAVIQNRCAAAHSTDLQRAFAVAA